MSLLLWDDGMRVPYDQCCSYCCFAADGIFVNGIVVGNVSLSSKRVNMFYCTRGGKQLLDVKCRVICGDAPRSASDIW
jgi:hypothetical protein